MVSEPPLFTAIAVPARGYAAALIATGYVWRNVVVEAEQTVSATSRIHEVTPGTRVFYFPSAQIRWVGEFVGLDTVCNAQVAKLRLRDERGNDRGIICVPFDRWNRIRVPDASRRVRLKPTATRLHEAELLFGLSIDGAHPPLPDKIVCQVFGNVSALRAEIGETEFAAVKGGVPHIGVLQHLIRVARWCTDGAGYGSEVFPIRMAQSIRTLSGLLIHDGSAAFLRSSKPVQAVNHVAILDRTEPRFDDAVAEVDRLFVSRSSGQPSRSWADVPRGLEVLSFEVRT